MNSVGQPVSRADGRLKVTGAARYTADIPVTGAAHAAIVHAPIARGTIRSLDTGAAENAPGVLAVLTYQNMPRMHPVPKPWSHLRPWGQSYLPLQDDLVLYAGQPVALVVAETLDQAAHAGTLIRITYDTDPPVVFDGETVRHAVDPPQFLWPVTSAVGDADKAIADAPVTLRQTYTTADRHHNQMEPHATTADWDADGGLTLHETTQHLYGARDLVSIVLGLPADKIRIVSHFVGGGFGGKAYVWPHTLLAAVAAKAVGRPVRLQLTRAQMYSMAGHQPATVQSITLGADTSGRLAGIRHESVTPSSVFDNYIEYAAIASRHLWGASGGISTGHKIVHVNRNTPTVMRSPHEALGHFATESAMDELAYAVGLDPVELRLRNDTMTDPLSGRPFSTRHARVPDGRCGALRLEPEVPGTALDAGWPLPHRPGRGGCDLYALALARHRADHAGRGRHGARRGGHARDRRRHLHRHAAGGRRRARPQAGQGDRTARRYHAALLTSRHRIGHDGQRGCVGPVGRPDGPGQGRRLGAARQGRAVHRSGRR
jgi:xanthine dehydrogenase YagR molybdenum-binding subunit